MRTRTRGALLTVAVGSTLAASAAPALAGPTLLTHGTRVSFVAITSPTDPIRGQFVSAVARLQQTNKIHPTDPIDPPDGDGS